MTRQVMIIGCGRLGATVARALLDRGDQVTVIDVDAENFRRLPARAGLQLYVGDGTSHEMLRKAGVESMSAFVAVTGQDTTNALAAQSARTTFGIETVVCRVNDPIRREMYEDLGLRTVSPHQVLTEMVLNAMEQ